MISETGKGLVSFVESYRKFTRIPQPEKEIIELNEFIQRMIILCSMEPNFSAITIQTQLTPENIRVYADPNLLGQVMLNLMKMPYKPYRTGKIRYCGLLRNNYQPAISGFKSSTMAREFLQI